MSSEKHFEMTENEEFISQSIFDQVRMGFLSVEDIQENIAEEIEDNGFENEISNAWAFNMIEKEHDKLVSESQKWIQPTDPERLIRAFDQLCENNIIALHCAGYTTSVGESDVIEVESRLRENQIVSDGYCFYHEQDLSRALSIENPSMCIAFQKVDNSKDEVTVAIGRRVVSALKDQKLQAEWDEDPRTKILLPNFKWQLLFDETNRDIRDHSHAERLIMHGASTTPHDDSENSTQSGEINGTNIWSKIKKLCS